MELVTALVSVGLFWLIVAIVLAFILGRVMRAGAAEEKGPHDRSDP